MTQKFQIQIPAFCFFAAVLFACTSPSDPEESADITLSERQPRTEQVMVTGSVLRAQQAPLPATQVVRGGIIVTGNTENYGEIVENPVELASEEPVSTFSIDVDTASYANVRRMIMQEGRLPPADAVRIEEFINYFDYSYDPPGSPETPFAVHGEIAPAPWVEGRHLLRIGIKGYEPEATERPPANLVFLVDVSGSMNMWNKLPLVKRSLEMLARELDADDRIALVVYAGAAGVVLESTPGNETRKIVRALEMLTAGGSTHGSAGLRLAYEIAQENFVEEGINRVLIASDGDMNVGVTGDDLIDLIKRKRESGIALTTLGFGGGNYNDYLMEQMADVGDGNSAYIDSLQEARRVLVHAMNSTLLTIADDVKVQVEFNPETVREYRLVGYSNRMLNTEDFLNDQVDAGEIGAGHTITAFYEIALVGSESRFIEDRRYSPRTEPIGEFGDELAYLRIRYKKPGEDESVEWSTPLDKRLVQQDFALASEDFRFASAVAGFGQYLANSDYSGNWKLKDIRRIANSARGMDDYGYRAEFAAIIDLTSALAASQ
ncbi:MAG: VWA domain-containing protein [Gammaproteobacteria bacterium]|nr:VWA domain-containing protein [Gammaproteobacteria bacterium]MYC59575.1 VWA domain-containing protein [Gammaproteobacteria bacterium]MYH85535.1 VWA domain-containing protein [Gammaproteobacteria bacterium]MYK05426.1 VWA domain-containing protein [Gammaproteobacteria bacterium]